MPCNPGFPSSSSPDEAACHVMEVNVGVLFQLDGRWRWRAQSWFVRVLNNARGELMNVAEEGGKEKENFGKNGGRCNVSERIANTNG